MATTTIMVPQSVIRYTCEALGVPISNALFYWHKSRGNFPSSDVGSKRAKYSLYEFDNAIDVINIWLKMKEVEIPEDLVRDKLTRVMNED